MLIVAEEHPENFLPLSLTRATFELRYGALCPLDRALLIAKDTGQKVGLQCRRELAEYLRAKTQLPVNEDISAENISEEDHEPFAGLPASTPWEILGQSDKLIAADWDFWNRHHHNHLPKHPSGVHVIGNARDVFLGERAVVQPGCVLDASGGPIIIAAGAIIKYSQIQGPVFVGNGCVIDGARLRPGTSLGPNCKVGGEVGATIFQSRVNKAHEGFVGHSWAGRWVNFGALATTSNLKNTYGEIRYQRDESTLVSTGVQFLGSLIGDHTKIGIGQLLSTGSNLGVGCNVFGGGLAPKYVPSFSWVGPNDRQEHDLAKCLNTVHATLARRNAKLRPQSEEVLRRVFDDTREEREKFIVHRSSFIIHRNENATL
jgi:UDP-N-acetylglucosamine diphosphorylase/glucosamine-1-phosphate N-acetyltransferase